MNFVARSPCPGRFALALGFWVASVLASDLEQNQPVRSAEKPVLIWDIDFDQADDLPRNWRSTDDPTARISEAGAPLGLRDLRASGSGEFTPAGLKLVLVQTRGAVIVFDLRQETHIFVNNLPVSWYAPRDWSNVGRSHSEIEADEAARVGSLKPGSKIDIRPGHPVKHGDANAVAAQKVTVDRASTERDVVEFAGASYVRITVTDHTRPLDSEVDRFVLAVRALPKDAWAHFHCEAGLGRTTTFMVLYDMLRNAGQLSLEEIVNRQKCLSHGYDVLQPDEPVNWKAPYAAERAKFIRLFYDYARANPSGQPDLWSEWLKGERQ